MNTKIPRIPPPIYFLSGLIVMIVLNSLLPIGHWLPFPWRYFGIIIIALGLILSLGSGIFFRKLGTNPRPGTRANVLVTKGAFRYTRNPMYLGLIIMLTGVGILLGSFSPLIVIPVVFLILHTQFVLREEKWMGEWFGDSYLKYKRETPRWLLQ
jgi:protein-S-isoprenylcysteine O-methyltransferase Ste14